MLNVDEISRLNSLKLFLERSDFTSKFVLGFRNAVGSFLFSSVFNQISVNVRA